jgi:colanic acid/amylovoran biosynthesis glycosyltransferase
MAENQPLRVLIVRFGSTPVTFLNRLVTGFAASGIHVSIAGDKNDHPGVMALDNVNLLWAPSWKGSFVVKAGRLLALFFSHFSFRRLPWLIAQVHNSQSLSQLFFRLYQYLPFMKCAWDLIYFPWNSTGIEYRSLFDLGIPVVISCRGSQVNIRPHLPGQEGYVQALRTSLHQATAVHCVSFDIQQSVIGLGANPDRCRIIRPAVDPDFFSPPAHPPDNQRFSLISTGSLIWRKSYETMLTALKHLVAAGIDAELHIIGEGPERQLILFTIHDLGLQNRVTLHGHLAPTAVRDQLRAADVFVLSSLSEGIANAALEAMSCGLPVVTSDCGGMREAVTDGVEGFIVPLRDPQAMAEALHKLSDDSTLRARMGATARARINKDFSLEQQVAEFINLFHEVSETKG